MKDTFLYSILKYRHSHISGEVLNIGIFFIFPKDGYSEFFFPKKIHRLKHAYYDLNETDIRAYLISFKSEAKKIQSKYNLNIIDKYFDDIIASRFLIKDATSLQFTPVKEATKVNNDIADTVKFYTEIYLKYYQSEVDLRGVQKHTPTQKRSR